MNVLTRATILTRLRAYLDGKESVVSLASWAFDQFYAEAEGEIVYEVGYRWILVQTLDDLMFGDNPHFKLERDEVGRLVQRLGTAGYTIDDEAECEAERGFDDEGE